MKTAAKKGRGEKITEGTSKTKTIWKSHSRLFCRQDTDFPENVLTSLVFQVLELYLFAIMPSLRPTLHLRLLNVRVCVDSNWLVVLPHGVFSRSRIQSIVALIYDKAELFAVGLEIADRRCRALWY